MKKYFLIITTISVSISQFAIAGTVTCSGVNPGIHKVQVTMKDGARPTFHFIQTDLTHLQSQPWSFDSDPRGIIEAKISLNRVNLSYGHHGLTVKISADADIFGYANYKDTETDNSGYRGKLVLWMGPGDNPKRTIYDVVCSKK